MALFEANARLECEVGELRSNGFGTWSNDQNQETSIRLVLNSLREAFLSKRGIEEALDNLTAIIAPDVLVKRDRQMQSGPRMAKRGRLSSPSREVPPNRQQQAQIDKLCEQFEAFKTKQSPAPGGSRIPKPKVAPAQTQKIAELEKDLNDARAQLDDSQKQETAAKKRAAERGAKVRELTEDLQRTQKELEEVKRTHQIEQADQTIEKAGMQAQLKALQSNAEYRVEYEKVKARVEILEAENAELRKPRPTGNAQLDRVLDAMSRMEGDIQQRHSALNRMALQLEDKFEEEKRDLENKHRRDVEEKNHQIRKLKAEFEQILADLEKTRRGK
jgi:DNA repair exonuclease SbcCD ATPase subunit